MNDERLEALFKEEAELKERLANVHMEMYARAAELKIEIGNWKCENPYGVCVYDASDIYLEDCLYCHKPDSRKQVVSVEETVEETEQTSEVGEE